MNYEIFEDKIIEIDRKTDELFNLLYQFKMLAKYSVKKESSMTESDQLFCANRQRKIYALFARGLNSLEVAEKMQDEFGGIWQAYNFIAHYRAFENYKVQYARAYLVNTLTKKTDLSYREIGKISGYSAGRVSQIAHTFKN